MATSTTESLHMHAVGLDALAPSQIAATLAKAQQAAAASVDRAIPAICAGASRMAHTIRQNGRLIYAAAGSSGLMAAADALELHGTFGLPHRQIMILMAGGLPTGPELPGAVEDETGTLAIDLATASPDDTIITVSASGSTTFTVEATRLAQKAGASVIGIANNADSALLEQADYPILLPTPPEAIAGSTRLGAATAQKIALNMLSTLMAVELGHVHDGMMVNVVADNAKLRQRAAAIVTAISGAAETDAKDALNAADGRVKTAVLVAAGQLPPETADSILSQTNGNLRAALAQINRR